MSTTTANTTATASTQEPVKNAPTEAQQAATQQKLEKMKAPVHEELLDHEAEAGNPHARIIAIALDESDSSAYAFQWALDNLINPKTDQVILLNCRPVVTVPASYGLVYMDYGDWIDQVESENMVTSHKLLRIYGAQVLKTGAKCRAIALRGDPRDELIYKVNNVKADMLVIGSRGMGAIKRTFLGSVSDYCVHHCPVPVVVVRPKENAK